jgi:hypothetical protein
MTPIFNGVADSGSLVGVDFYRVDIDHANDIVQHVGGQTVSNFLFRIHAHPFEACTRHIASSDAW